MGDMNLIKYKLGKLGYTFFEVGEEIIIDTLIIELIKSGDSRYVKAIPFLIYQSYVELGKKPSLDLEKLHWSAKESGLEKEVNAVLYVTMEIFKATEDRKDMVRSISFYLKKYSSEKEKRIFELLFKNKTGSADREFEDYARNKKINWLDFNEMLEEYRKDKMINWMDLGEMSSDFLMHKSLKEIQERRTLKERLDISRSRDMMMHLSEIFSPRQREIIQKIIDEKPLSKTEYEYYIRVIKKRLDAIVELKDLAETAIKKKPKRIFLPASR